MKKKDLALGIMTAALTIGLVACDFREGVDHQFGVRAESAFIEIDDDTMELETSDGDDIANFDMLAIDAESKPEKAFVGHMEEMLELQGKVVDGDRDALKAYLAARNAAIQSVGLEGYHSVPIFEFIEEDDEYEYESEDEWDN